MKSTPNACILVFAAAILAQGGYLAIHGISLTRDFTTYYEPAAINIISWFQGKGEFPEITTPYQLFHYLYVGFIGTVYVVFGEGNHQALIAIQIIKSSFVGLLMFRFLQRNYDSKAVAVFFTVATFLFFDSMCMVIAGSPESLYRSLYVAAVLMLVHFHHNEQTGRFAVLGLASFAVLLFIRIDTIVLFIPVYALAIKSALNKLRVSKLSVPAISVSIMITLMVLSLLTKVADVDHALLALDQEYYKEGIVVADLDAGGKIQRIDAGERLSASEAALRWARLFILRIYQYLNLRPPSWSKTHQVYYALHMIPLYLFALVGLVRVWQTRSLLFSVITQCYAASIVLHAMTRVDAAHRTNFVSILFLMMLSGYGFDVVYGFVRHRASSVMDAAKSNGLIEARSCPSNRCSCPSDPYGHN